jgi:hypothetical protein
MDIAFFPGPSDPHGPVRNTLDDLLSKGTTRIMVACAFCSGAGVVIMRRHLDRLRARGSCMVISADAPTDIEAVNDLARQAPGAVWLHETGKLPREKGVGSALMHSKVFYSEAGDDCWLWVGSHNLTGRATTGANLEAALLLSGHPSDAPFQAARQHIEACRAEASPCPVEPPPVPDGDSVDVVVIHAETHALPGDPVPWHVRLGLQLAEFDWSLRPPATVRLYLYRPGELVRGWQRASPCASYGGTLTGLNFTDIHPQYPGIAARWDDKHYSITEERAVLEFSKSSPRATAIVTQAVITIKSLVPSDELFLPARPKVEQEELQPNLVGWADDDLAQFFTRRSVQDGQLVYEICRRGKTRWQMSVNDLREADRHQLVEETGLREIELFNVLEEERPRHPLIMRAKYQLRRRQV